MHEALQFYAKSIRDKLHWTTAEGIVIPLSSIADRHLVHIENYVRKKIDSCGPSVLLQILLEKDYRDFYNVSILNQNHYPTIGMNKEESKYVVNSERRGTSWMNEVICMDLQIKKH